MERSGPIGYGNHSDEATANASGTSLLEATRPAIVVVAAHGFRDNALDRPVGVATMARGHMIVDSGMPAIARTTHVGSNAFALGEDLNGPRRHPHFDRGARVAIGH